MSNPPRYGAHPQEWDILSTACGLTADLLPVVSNPDAPISPASDMKFRGKTPSLYNRKGQVVGIATWTTNVSVTADVREWREQPDYGVCVQTRKVRTLDLDVSDPVLVAEIEKFVRAVLGADVALAVRRRPNSSKCLLAFEVTDIPADQDLYKRTVLTKAGMIEFLATGQQFIAYGTHPSGVRYEWENEGEFPDIPLHVFESLWERLCKRFGIGEPTSSAARKRGAVLAGATDRIINQLEDNGQVLGWGRDGQAHIECPFSAEHTTESALSATSYFPAGSGGYELGHFSCLHAHCEHRTDQEFMDKLGLHVVAPASMLALTNALEDAGSYEEPPLPAFKRHDNGQVLATAKNVELALAAPHACGFHIARDTFLEEIMLRPYMMGGGVSEWRRLTDEDYMRLRLTLENLLSFENLATGLVREVLHVVASEHQFDSAYTYVDGLKWDGTPRVDRFFTDYIKTTDAKFGKAVARYLFTALAGRALVPGIKADMVPILISGEQGLLKTSAVEALAPIPDVFVDFNLAADDEKRVRLIKGKMVAEIGEMRGLWGSQIEDIKAFLSRRYDKWVPKYKEQSTHYARRCIFIGTGNNYDILNDPTGSRRFLPMTVLSADVEAIKRDAEQLWAEGTALFKQHGVMWQDAQGMGKVNNANYTTEDPWVEIVREWLDQRGEDGKNYVERHGSVTTAEVLTLALGHNKSAINSGLAKRVSEVMRVVGFNRGLTGAWVIPARE